MSSRLHSPLTACRQPKKNLSCFQWFFSSLKYEVQYTGGKMRDLECFLISGKTIIMPAHTAVPMPGVGGWVIPLFPQHYIFLLLLSPPLLYHNRTHWLEIIPILVNFSFVPLAISRLSSQKKVRCLIIPDWTLPSAHSAILQLPENWQLATNHKDIIMQKSDKIAEDRVKRSPLVCDVRSVNYCWAENQAQLTITLLAPVLTKTQEVDSTC